MLTMMLHLTEEGATRDEHSNSIIVIVCSTLGINWLNGQIIIAFSLMPFNSPVCHQFINRRIRHSENSSQWHLGVTYLGPLYWCSIVLQNLHWWRQSSCPFFSTSLVIWRRKFIKDWSDKLTYMRRRLAWIKGERGRKMVRTRRFKSF